MCLKYIIIIYFKLITHTDYLPLNGSPENIFNCLSNDSVRVFLKWCVFLAASVYIRDAIKVLIPKKLGILIIKNLFLLPLYLSTSLLMSSSSLSPPTYLSLPLSISPPLSFCHPPPSLPLPTSPSPSLSLHLSPSVILLPPSPYLPLPPPLYLSTSLLLSSSSSLSPPTYLSLPLSISLLSPSVILLPLSPYLPLPPPLFLSLLSPVILLHRTTSPSPSLSTPSVSTALSLPYTFTSPFLLSPLSLYPPVASLPKIPPSAPNSLPYLHWATVVMWLVTE